MSRPVDIVYALGSGSVHSDVELMYSLRSVETYVLNYRNIYIVGARPHWLQNVIHIPAADEWQKEVNIKNKILLACDHADISSDFLFMNDDHFFTAQVDAHEYPYYFKGWLEKSVQARRERRQITEYYQTLVNTVQVLQKRGLRTQHFDIHTPIVYNAADFKRIMAQYDWTVPAALAIKSIYCNTRNITGMYLQDCRINRPMYMETICERVRGRDVFSIGDEGINNAMLQFLDHRYPNKSKYEK